MLTRKYFPALHQEKIIPKNLESDVGFYTLVCIGHAVSVHAISVSLHCMEMEVPLMSTYNKCF